MAKKDDLKKKLNQGTITKNKTSNKNNNTKSNAKKTNINKQNKNTNIKKTNTNIKNANTNNVTKNDIHKQKKQPKENLTKKSKVKNVKLQTKNNTLNNTKSKEKKDEKQLKKEKRQQEKIKKEQEKRKEQKKEEYKKYKKEKEKINQQREKEKEKIKKQKKEKALLKKLGFLKKITHYLKKNKNMILGFIVLVITITSIMYILSTNKKEIYLKYNVYKIGEKIQLIDDSYWYVVKESSKNEQYLVLLSEKIDDINNDGKIDKNDKVSYDENNDVEYNIEKEQNIGYFINNKLTEKLNKIPNIKKIRLLTSEEYIKIRDAMEFGYDWKEGNFLASKETSMWWLETIKYNKVYVVTEKGTYRLYEPKSKQYIRPVIEIDKSSVKTHKNIDKKNDL